MLDEATLAQTATDKFFRSKYCQLIESCYSSHVTDRAVWEQFLKEFLVPVAQVLRAADQAVE